MLKIVKKLIQANGNFPGNQILPLLHFQNAFDLKNKKGSATIKKHFSKTFGTSHGLMEFLTITTTIATITRF